MMKHRVPERLLYEASDERQAGDVVSCGDRLGAQSLPDLGVDLLLDVRVSS